MSLLRIAYLEMTNQFPGGWESMPAALGLTRAALQNRIYGCKGQSVSVDQAFAMQSLSNSTAFAQAVAELSGGTFVKLPDIEAADNTELLHKFNRLYQKVGTLAQQFTDFTEDSVIEAHEKASLKRTSAEIHRSVEELLALTFLIYCDEAPLGAKGE